ncbi:hypothetical protein C9374_002633 [Naegleria lovaniensis]|uniref:Uncharacterized protein n=1 Tax=Naegleria lovaniensis TaxID=51637 RepID=A0AA88KQ90_NAELO|nr:uncharacterized protein C9374_002633 [Naegleria lovaniensis]KAG2386187.1 hypothetical protein C9374_002633 [Naegleria lovaniensis]
MTSKHKLCDRLKKVGYSVNFMTPHNNSLFAGELLHNTADAEELFSTSLIQHFLVNYYGHLNKFLEHPEKFFNDKGIKNNVVFCDATPLYPLIYDPNIESEVQNSNNKVGDLFKQTLQIMKEKNVLVMQLSADRHESAYRLGNHKYFYTEDWSDNQEKQIEYDPTTIHIKNKPVEPLSTSQYDGKFHYFNGKYLKDEFEIVDFVYHKFNQLASTVYGNNGIEVRPLETTDTQQACCLLLENHLKIKFTLPFSKMSL